MRIVETQIEGIFFLEAERFEDDRGFFARTWCQEKLTEAGLKADISQSSISFNKSRGTLRGLHFQDAPFGEHKVIRCTKGSICDVALDLRPDSKTFKKFVIAELSEWNHLSLYLSPGIAHGFQTLVDNSEVLYLMDQIFRPDAARGVRWNDPAFQIPWPQTESRTMSARDAQYPDFLS